MMALFAFWAWCRGWTPLEYEWGLERAVGWFWFIVLGVPLLIAAILLVGSALSAWLGGSPPWAVAIMILLFLIWMKMK
jgi:hypothetical protein